MFKLLEQFNLLNLKKNPDVRPGDTVKVHQKIKEGNKERVQIFEGLVIAKKHGTGVSATITVRKVVDGIGVERIFPLHATFIEKIEIIRRGKVRRSKLYFLRTAKGRKAKLKNKDFAEAIVEEPVVEEVAEEAPSSEAEQPAAESAEEAPKN